MPNFTILEPMSTGDVIDRAVRLYRRNFAPLVAIVSVPTLIGYVASLMFWYGYQHLFLGEAGSSSAPDDAIWMLILGGLGYPVWLFTLLLTISGLARVIGDHVMLGDSITFRKCFSSVRSRLSDITIMGILTMLILFGLYIIFMITLLILALVVGVVVGFVIAIQMPQWAVTSITIVAVLIAIAAGLFLVSMLIARVVFLPQIVMIEGGSAGTAIGRAINLGRRNSFKVGAILLFTYFVSLSLMSALTLPVLAGLFLAGLLNSEFFSSTLWTVFYTSFKDVSSLLSLPIWIVSFTLLYFDSRVRKEAYDLELLARDIAPGYYWQPLAEAGAFGYQMPFVGGQGRAFVQTSPLGLAGYRSIPTPVVNAPPLVNALPQPAQRPDENLVEQDAVNSSPLETAQNDGGSCKKCGASLLTAAPFCGNCGSPAIALKS